ncbi:MAG: CRISPR-associated endonuclease Cas2 [Clostridiales bacterium]|nr:CRISPR-associated endonuclease Cas2 [Clostridiales bacterium]
MEVLVAYDVNTETKEGRRRLRQVATVCLRYGQRVQKSLFECRLDLAKLEEMVAELIDIIDAERDSLRIYILPGKRKHTVKVYGLDHYVDFDEPLVL